MTHLDDTSSPESFSGQFFLNLPDRSLVYEEVYVFYDTPLLFGALDQFGTRYLVNAIDFGPDTTQ